MAIESLESLQEPHNFNPNPHFHFIVSELFDKLDSVTKDNLGNFRSLTAKKSFIIDEFIKNWKHYIGNNILPAVKLIFPHRDGRLYFMKDVGLSRLIIKMFKIPKNSIDYKQIMDWKKNYHEYKNFAQDKRKLRTLPYILAQQISELRDIQPPGDVVTIHEVNELLDKLNVDDMGKQDQQIALLEPFLAKLNTSELRWFFQIILKESMIAPMETYFYMSWHPDAPAFSNVVNNLKAVFWKLTDPSQRLKMDDLKVHLMYPFLPQLATKPNQSYEKLANKLGNNFFIEEKIDGDRMIMHMKRNPQDSNDIQFKYYTRRCRDYSLLYGEDLKFGALSKHLRNAFHEGVTSLILDGEMVAWDYRRNVILPFGTLKASAVQEAVRHFTVDDAFADQLAWPFFIIYDVLYLNGIHLSGTKLIERKQALKKIINEIPNRFEILIAPIGHTAQDIENAVRKAVSERSEGIMIKDINSKYKIAQRDACWIKIKPEYLEQFGENLDLPIIGVIKGVKNAFMCALKDETTGVYKSFCTVANGFSEKEYDEIARITQGKWHKYKFNMPPSDKILFGTRKPDEWIYPEDSLVLEIKARSIDSQPLATYAVGTTLHNLYCRRIRNDKNYEECITLQMYKEMKQLHSKDISKKQEVIEKSKKRTKEEMFEGDFNLSLIVPSKNIFNGLTSLVLSGRLDLKTGKRISDVEIAKLIKENGGSIVQAYDASRVDSAKFICISESLTIKAKEYFKLGFDLIKPEWIFTCIKYGKIVALEPIFILKSSQQLLDYASNFTDEYGDSYTTEIDEPILNYFKKIKCNDFHSKSELQHIKDDFINSELPKNELDLPLNYLLYGLNFYICHSKLTDFWKIDALCRKIQRFGGSMVTNISNATMIVFVEYDQNDLNQNEEIVQIANEISQQISQMLPSIGIDTFKIPSIVQQSFIDQSIKNGALVDVNDHKV